MGANRKAAACLAGAVVFAALSAARAEDLLPKHINTVTQKAIQRGLDFLAKSQGEDGAFTRDGDGQTYPVAMTSLAGMAFLANGNTPSRGPYSENVAKIVEFLINNTRANGLISGPAQEHGYSMYGHGFAMLFLSSCYGMETDDRTRERMKKIINDAVTLTGSASSNGGWCYQPNQGDEGSVTITQMQGLRAASNAGFTVPKGIIEGGVHYLEMCKGPEGGICYSLSSVGGDGSHLPISAAAIATLYNAGQYDSKLADSCLAYVSNQFDIMKDNFSKGGNDYYTHLYAAQAFYQAGDKYWDKYFPLARDQLLKQQGTDGGWRGEVGQTYCTSIALIVLQLPYKYLPIYQR